MRYIPEQSTNQIIIERFTTSLAKANDTETLAFDHNEWIYLPVEDQAYRYILGSRGENPLICVGINPSTARPGALDNTLKSVERIALANGFDSFIMFNVYAQRATSPDDMDKECNYLLHQENLEAFRYCLSLAFPKAPCVWAAWGTIIEKRPWLKELLCDFVEVSKDMGAKWFTAGNRSKKGHPHHPLYLAKHSSLESFAIEDYLRSLDMQ